MKSRTLIAGLAVCGLTLALSVAAQSSLPRDNSSTPGSEGYTDLSRGTTHLHAGEIEKLDKDSDGKVSKEEAKADLTWRSKFDELDANGDGMVDVSEVAALEAKTPAVGKGRTTGGKDDLPTPSY